MESMCIVLARRLAHGEISTNVILPERASIELTRSLTCAGPLTGPMKKVLHTLHEVLFKKKRDDGGARAAMAAQSAVWAEFVGR